MNCGTCSSRMVTLLVRIFPEMNGTESPLIALTGNDAQICRLSPTDCPVIATFTFVSFWFRPMRSFALHTSAFVASVVLLGFEGGVTVTPLMRHDGAFDRSFTTPRRAA